MKNKSPNNPAIFSNNHQFQSRRFFLKTMACSIPGIALLPKLSLGADASGMNIAQLIYSGGNWQPRPGALRKLAWEIQKRSAINTLLEPYAIKPLLKNLSQNPLLYLAGDRPFPLWNSSAILALSRHLKLGGTMIVDPAITQDGDTKGFQKSVATLLENVLPSSQAEKLSPGHVVYRTFYDLQGPAGRNKGSNFLTGYPINKRIAVFVGDHDMGAAWARDNLGNWEYDIPKGGERQRENAFRTGINLVMYALCGDYKNETPHKHLTSAPGR